MEMQILCMVTTNQLVEGNFSDEKKETCYSHPNPAQYDDDDKESLHTAFTVESIL